MSKPYRPIVEQINTNLTVLDTIASANVNPNAFLYYYDPNASAGNNWKKVKVSDVGGFDITPYRNTITFDQVYSPATANLTLPTRAEMDALQGDPILYPYTTYNKYTNVYFNNGTPTPLTITIPNDLEIIGYEIKMFFADAVANISIIGQGGTPVLVSPSSVSANEGLHFIYNPSIGWARIK